MTQHFRQPLPRELKNKQTGEVVDVVNLAECPRCGFPLDDSNDLAGPLKPGSWWQSTTRAQCGLCGHVYQVRLTFE